MSEYVCRKSLRRYPLALLVPLVALGLCGAGAAAAEARLQDPMMPPAEAAPAVSRVSPQPVFRLTSTLIAGERKVAVINGQPVAEGDRVAGAQVLEILPTQVRLVWSGRELTVRLLPLGVKKPVTQASHDDN